MNFKKYYLTEAKATSFMKFYKDQERGLQPDDHVIMDCLMILANYYADYLQWYEDHPSRQIEQEGIVKDFTKQLMNIRKAIVSHDVQEQIIAIDQGINQWHHDYPVVAHLAMEAGYDDDMAEEEWFEVADLLNRLGRLPEKSPYSNEF